MLRHEHLVPVLAFFSPLGVVLVSGAIAAMPSTGISAPASFTLRVGAVAWGLATALCGFALWRLTDRDGRILSTLGLIGNGLVLISAIAYLALR